MAWICAAGGQVTPSLLAYWRCPWRSGDRDARAMLLSYAQRGWMKRGGTRQYPLYCLTETGAAMAANAGVETLPPRAHGPRPSAMHDAAVAAILERAKDLEVIDDWRPGFGISQDDPPDKLTRRRKLPDAVARIGGEWHAVELEASKKGGRLQGGRSNWAWTAVEVRKRLESPQHVYCDGEDLRLKKTVMIALTPLLAAGIQSKLDEHEASAIWLVGDRLEMRLQYGCGSVGLLLLNPPPKEEEAAVPAAAAVAQHDADDNEPILEDL
jgi:hypothetical protein